MDATHLQTAVPAARPSCWGTLTTGNTHLLTQTLQDLFFNTRQTALIRAGRLSQSHCGPFCGIIQWKVAGCGSEQDVHLQDRSVCHRRFLFRFCSASVEPIRGEGFFHGRFLTSGVAAPESHGATGGSGGTEAGSSEMTRDDLLIGKCWILDRVHLHAVDTVIHLLFSFTAGVLFETS